MVLSLFRLLLWLPHTHPLPQFPEGPSLNAIDMAHVQMMLCGVILGANSLNNKGSNHLRLPFLELSHFVLHRKKEIQGILHILGTESVLHILHRKRSLSLHPLKIVHHTTPNPVKPIGAEANSLAEVVTLHGFQKSHHPFLHKIPQGKRGNPELLGNPEYERAIGQNKPLSSIFISPGKLLPERGLLRGGKPGVFSVIFVGIHVASLRILGAFRKALPYFQMASKRCESSS
jgi:hypothetical protein